MCELKHFYTFFILGGLTSSLFWVPMTVFANDEKKMRLNPKGALIWSTLVAAGAFYAFDNVKGAGAFVVISALAWLLA